MNSTIVFPIVKSGLKLCKANYTNTLVKCIQRKMATTVFEGEGDRFRGITVRSNIEQIDIKDFQNKLEASLKQWRMDKKRTIWFQVFLDQSEWVPALTKYGFKYHHAKEDYVMMYLWLPKDESNNIPYYAHTLVGVGGMVINEKSQVLVVREKYGLQRLWKLPGGYVEPGEDLIDAAVREVMEETNISTKFQSVIGLRHTQERVYNCSDLYIVVNLKATSQDIIKSDQEISECVWMDIEEYLNHSEVSSHNKFLVQKYLEYQDKKICIDYVKDVHEIFNFPYTFYSVKESGNSSNFVRDTVSS